MMTQLTLSGSNSVLILFLEGGGGGDFDNTILTVFCLFFSEGLQMLYDNFATMAQTGAIGVSRKSCLFV